MAIDIKDLVDQKTMLLGLAEEASELAQAALKLHRGLDGKNPTSLSKEEAITNFNEEIADLRLYEDNVVFVNEDMIYQLRLVKMARWLTRLMERAQGHDDDA